ncbi:MAG TPA: YggS family pyridoxal phosphate-dependent enzyme, partial [Gemmatimonadaceae bacterium]|nr:YggS family pyridoxal phosphate-dependent enzyme [Gemmatimonadaceae bacterium]
GQQVTLIAVTKTHGPDVVDAAARAGVCDVGENKVQEALSKMPDVTEPVRWHLIGHMQRNKVKHVDQFALVHSVDSERLARALDAHGQARGKAVEVLLQVNVSGEASKGGVEPDELDRVAQVLAELPGLRVRGVMTMAPFDAGEGTLRRVFAGARNARSALVAAGLAADELSMGMSGDYEVAVEEGATMVRLGTVLFGARTT